MKIEIPYVREIKLCKTKEVLLKNGKKFYQRKIVINADQEITTMLLNGMKEDYMNLKLSEDKKDG